MAVLLFLCWRCNKRCNVCDYVTATIVTRWGVPAGPGEALLDDSGNESPAVLAVSPGEVLTSNVPANAGAELSNEIRTLAEEDADLANSTRQARQQVVQVVHMKAFWKRQKAFWKRQKKWLRRNAQSVQQDSEASLAISEPRALLPGAPEVDVAAIVALGAGLGADVPKVQVGSGFFCSSEGFLITCHHVLLDLQQVAPGAHQICVGVGSPLTWTYRAEVLWISSRPGLSPQRHGDPMLDLAIMRVTSCLDHAQKLDSFPFLRLSDSDTARQGDRIWIYGYGQQRSDITDTSNVVSGDLAGKHTDADGNWLRTTADMLSGHSGGPAVNYDGSVIGWCVKSHREGASDKSAAGGLHALRPINDAKIQFRAAGLSIC
jgi:S1-C subfamily serine protease